jgi:hypothetical protein
VNPIVFSGEILRSDSNDIVSMVAMMSIRIGNLDLTKFSTALLALAMIASAATASDAADVKTFVKDGYQITETTKTSLVWEPSYEDKKQTVQVQKIEPEMQSMVQTYQVPVTEWVLEPQVVNRWNPFVTPSVQYQYVQRTRWETKQHTVQVPVYKPKWVNEERTVRVPQMVQKEREEIVRTKVALRDLPTMQNNSALVKSSPGFQANGSNAPLNPNADPNQGPRMAAAPRQPGTLQNPPAGAPLGSGNPQSNGSGFNGAQSNGGFGAAPPPTSTMPNGGGFGGAVPAQQGNSQALPLNYPTQPTPAGQPTPAAPFGAR